MSASIYAAIDQGYAVAGNVLGTPYQQFRPYGPNDPLSPLNAKGDLSVWLTADPKLMGGQQSQYGKPVWYGAFGRDATQAGDFLTGALGIFFLASLSIPSAPIMLVQCNDTVSVARMTSDFTPGANAGEDGDATETVFAANWPCSLLQMGSGSKMSGSSFKLPSDAKVPGCAILLPPIPGVTIEQNDILTDQEGARWAVTMAEFTDLGWRLAADQWTA